MIEQLKKRLETLKENAQQGQQQLTELRQQEKDLETTLIRISGAIQVLEEEIKEAESAEVDIKKAS